MRDTASDKTRSSDTLRIETLAQCGIHGSPAPRVGLGLSGARTRTLTPTVTAGARRRGPSEPQAAFLLPILLPPLTPVA